MFEEAGKMSACTWEEHDQAEEDHLYWGVVLLHTDAEPSA